jgi:hypothetical protein
MVALSLLSFTDSSVLLVSSMRRSRRKGMEAGADELTWWGMKGEGKERIYKTKGRRTLRKKRLCKNQVKWRDGICLIIIIIILIILHYVSLLCTLPTTIFVLNLGIRKGKFNGSRKEVILHIISLNFLHFCCFAG